MVGLTNPQMEEEKTRNGEEVTQLLTPQRQGYEHLPEADGTAYRFD